MIFGSNKRVWICVCGVALGAGLICYWLASREVTYAGKPVREWAIRAAAGEREAEDALAELGPRAVPELVRLLHGKEAFWRRYLWRSAPSLPVPVRGAVNRAAGIPKVSGIRSAAAVSLGKLKEVALPAIPDLVAVLEDANPELRWNAATALSRIGAPAVPDLISALQKPNADARHAAAYALGEIGLDAYEATPAFAPLLNDKNENVRASAAHSLKLIRTAYFRSLAEALEKGDRATRQAAFASLGEISREMLSLRPVLQKLTQAPDPETRRQALQALAALRVPDDTTLHVLAVALEDPDAATAATAANALALAGPRARKNLPVLTNALSHVSPEVRQSAARAIKRIVASSTDTAREMPTSQ